MQIGTYLGHYQILEQLGGGGMASVYRARDTRLDRHVALKLLPAGASRQRERLARFRREALAIAALDHPNVVALHSVEEHEGRHFITMQLVEGRTLAEAIPDRGMRPAEICDLAIPLSDAIAAAHAQGVAHRDLKPANLMVGADGRIRVLDFGLAKLLHEAPSEHAGGEPPPALTQEGGVIGTTAYMSPEQAEGRSVDHRSDIFALGILLYEMATGRRPFEGDTPAATAASILRDEPPAIRELRSDIPEQLQRIVDRCLQKQPQQRFPTAGDLRDELTRLREELSGAGSGRGEHGGGRPEASPHTPSDAAVLARLARRHRGVTIGGGLALVAAVSTGSWLLWNRGDDTPVSDRITHQLTSVQGLELGMDWSPDAGFIVFSHGSRGNLDIAMKPTAGGAWVDLTRTPDDEIDPRWAPNSRWVAYVRDAPSGARIELVPPTGGEPRVLVNTGMRIWAGIAQATDAMGASPWSPDGDWFVYPQWNASTGATAIFRIHVETAVSSRLTRPQPGVFDMAPSWSPDGRRIVFQRADGTGQRLWVVGSEGGDEALLFDDEVPAGRPDFSNDGRRVIFVSSRAGSQDIWEIDVDDPDRPRRVTSGPGYEGTPIASPAGGIGYQTFVHRSDVYRQRIDDVEAERNPLIVETPGINNFGARMSPDGRSVVYYSDRSGNDDIWLLALESRQSVALTSHPAQDILADWSPSGQLVFLSNRGGTFQLWSLDPDRPQPRRISDQPVTIWHVGSSFSQGPRFSRDGKAIGYLATDADGPALWTISPDGSNARRRLPGVIWFGWYLDSSRVIYTRTSQDGARMELWAADLDRNVQRPLLQEPIDEIDVAPDGRAVAFQTAVSHINMRLRVLELTGPDPVDGLPRAAGPPRYLPAADGIWHVHNSSWSWDGESILYTRDEDEGDIYLTEERR